MDQEVSILKFGDYEVKQLDNHTVVINWIETMRPHQPLEMCRVHFNSENELAELGALLVIVANKLDDLEDCHPMGQS